MTHHKMTNHKDKWDSNLEDDPLADSPPSWLLQKLLDDIPSDAFVGSPLRAAKHRSLRMPLLGAFAAIAASVCLAVGFSLFFAKPSVIAKLPPSVQSWETDPCYVLPPTSF